MTILIATLANGTQIRRKSFDGGLLSRLWTKLRPIIVTGKLLREGAVIARK